MRYTPERIGAAVREVRMTMHITQKTLAMTAGTGLRFISELEKGKPTCEFGKVLTVLNTLGIDMKLTPPSGAMGQGATSMSQGATASGRQGFE